MNGGNGEHGPQGAPEYRLADWFDARLLELDLDRLVILRREPGADAKLTVIGALVARLDGVRLVRSRRQVLKAIHGGAEVPEEQGHPGEAGDPVFVHVISSAVEEPAVVFARSDEGLAWNAGEEPASHLIFLIALPPNAEEALPEIKAYLRQRLEEAGETLRRSRAPKLIMEALVVE